MTVCTFCAKPITRRPSRLEEGRLLWTSAFSSIPLVCWKAPGLPKNHQPAPTFEEQVAEAVRDVETAVLDCRADSPDMHDDDRYHDMVVSVTFGLPGPVANEVRRRFGFDPRDF